MLGVYSPHKPITGKFAQEIREAAMRMAMNTPNEREKETMRRSRELRKKWHATWNWNKSI